MFMFSSIDGAKKSAKKLASLFDNCGFAYPLNKCQRLLARACAFNDWHALERTLAATSAAVERAAFNKRLVAAAPEPCQAPLISVIDAEPAPPEVHASAPVRWYSEVLPYVIATVALQEAGTAAGPSGGLHLLLDAHGGSPVFPRLDPDSLDLIYAGNGRGVFRQAAGDMGSQLEALARTGVVRVKADEVRVRAPDPAAVARLVRDMRSGKSSNRINRDGFGAFLTAPLSAIAAPDARRIDEALHQLGSGAFIVPAGAILDLMSRFAEEGRIETFAQAYGLLSVVLPSSARDVRDAIPAKITSLYLMRHRRLDAVRFLSWTAANADWPDRLKKAAARPTALRREVEAMAASVTDLAA